MMPCSLHMLALVPHVLHHRCWSRRSSYDGCSLGVPSAAPTSDADISSGRTLVQFLQKPKSLAGAPELSSTEVRLVGFYVTPEHFQATLERSTKPRKGFSLGLPASNPWQLGEQRLRGVLQPSLLLCVCTLSDHLHCVSPWPPPPCQACAPSWDGQRQRSPIVLTARTHSWKPQLIMAQILPAEITVICLLRDG